jgi:hypothetical protein
MTLGLSVRILLVAVFSTGLLGCPLSPSGSAPSMGTLKLTIVDAATGQEIPARVEIRGADDAYHVAADALRVGGDCDMSDEGAGYRDLATTLASFSDRIENPYTASTQFYSAGTSSIPLPSGAATVKVFKGPEYTVGAATIEITASATVEHTLSLTRWTNMPERGWYSADDHLHVPRPSAELNPAISQMMQAEDIHVANLLQMGKVENFEIAPQYAHGPEGHYQEGHFILAAGQENPRNHFLGHTITLGASTARHDLDHYLIYRLLWETTAAEGALNGFAHAYAPNGMMIAVHDGMAVVAPHDLLHFMEVLQFNRSGYEAWYELLALGFRVTPTAGTDYPCGGQSLPGHERFYTKVEGPLRHASWLYGVRQGRTFVTTGPIVEFHVNDMDIGGEVFLSAEASVEIRGKATFDPTRDDLAFLELVQNGEVVERFSRVAGASEIEFETKRPVDESSWFALRGYGTRLENTFGTPFHFNSFKPSSNVHTAPIYVTLAGRPGIGESAQAKRVARAWVARLEDLERTLAEENVDFLARRLAFPDADAVPRETLVRNREALLEEVRGSKAFFEARASR